MSALPPSQHRSISVDATPSPQKWTDRYHTGQTATPAANRMKAIAPMRSHSVHRDGCQPKSWVNTHMTITEAAHGYDAPTSAAATGAPYEAKSGSITNAHRMNVPMSAAESTSEKYASLLRPVPDGRAVKTHIRLRKTVKAATSNAPSSEKGSGPRGSIVMEYHTQNASPAATSAMTPLARSQKARSRPRRLRPATRAANTPKSMAAAWAPSAIRACDRGARLVSHGASCAATSIAHKAHPALRTFRPPPVTGDTPDGRRVEGSRRMNVGTSLGMGRSRGRKVGGARLRLPAAFHYTVGAAGNGRRPTMDGRGRGGGLAGGLRSVRLARPAGTAPA
jgi:hypothetical protein